MGLLEQHKADRRRRIQAAARRLISERGYDGLTMRDLADASRVSVPTLYNLFGGKDAIVVAELEASASRIAAQLPPIHDGFFARGMFAFEAGMRLIEDDPPFYRAAMKMFLTSTDPDTHAMRRRTEQGFIAIMEGNLAAAKAAGQLADWAEPPIVARHMFALYMAAFLGWGLGELDLPTFRAAALSGMCHLVAGVARGAMAADVETRLRELRETEPLRSFISPPQEVADAVRSRD